MANAKGKAMIRDIKGGKKPRNPVTLTALSAGGTGATAGAFDTAINRDSMITRVNAIIQLLKDLGFAI